MDALQINSRQAKHGTATKCVGPDQCYALAAKRSADLQDTHGMFTILDGCMISARPKRLV
jgi:hypothetical protein